MKALTKEDLIRVGNAVKDIPLVRAQYTFPSDFYDAAIELRDLLNTWLDKKEVGL